jgi:hypothetical protein
MAEIEKQNELPEEVETEEVDVEVEGEEELPEEETPEEDFYRNLAEDNLFKITKEIKFQDRIGNRLTLKV